MFNEELEERVRKLEGNQARIALLYLIDQWKHSDPRMLDIDNALEIAESYSPESPLKSF